MDSLEIVNEYIGVLTEESEVESYYIDKVNWAKFRKDNWQNDFVRVGVIGVTSSGKSTLINALLGCDILSSAVAPSSGQLVCCSFGNEFKATIRFSDKKPIVLRNKNFSTERLMVYSDERLNPHNSKNVVSIELQSPFFDLGSNVLLIDSPGLDAYGLEIHEKLTLETLVPTIDVCIYVTTMKTNSDRKAEEILNVVARYDCPLVIVQNMLDAVRPSPSGDKSSEQVALDHLKRVKRIIANSDIKNKNSVEVVQLSAENARKWRLKIQGQSSTEVTEEDYFKSKYEDFVEVVRHFLDIRKPDIEFQRIESITNEIKIVLSDINGELNGIPATISQTIDDEILINDVLNTSNGLKNEYESIMDKAVVYSVRLFSEIEQASEYSIESCTKSVNEYVTSIGNSIHQIIQAGNEKLVYYANLINIPVRDILKSPSFDLYKGINVEKKTKNTTKKIKDSGVKGFLNRIKNIITNDDSGYHYETKTEVIIDVEETRRLLIKRLNESLTRFERLYSDWLVQSFDVTTNEILNELKQIKAANIARKKIEIRNEKLSKTASLLSNLLQRIDNQRCSSNIDKEINPVVIKQEKRVHRNKIEVNIISEQIVTIAGNAIKKQHVETMKMFIKSKGLLKHQPLAIGWDYSCIEEFEYQAGITDLQIFDLSKCNDLSIPKDYKKCIFLMVNATQIGAAEKQIRSIKLEDMVTPSDFLVWVIQDFEEVLNGNDVGEAIQGLMRIRRSYLNTVSSSTWVVHRNPIYNICILNYQEMNISSIIDENEFIHDIQEKYACYCDDETIKNVGKIIRKC